MKRVCEATGVTDGQLCDPSRNRKAAEVRSVIGHLAMQTGCAALTEVAQRFGRDVATLSKGVRRLGKQAVTSQQSGSSVIPPIGTH
ncbi:MAG: helix-turn-helix domain-containing protein, partial [Candidatus Methylomirabilales bacterium]